MIYREIPGKLFLMGEYSVMKPGHPAIVLAVDRCLRACISENDVPRVEIPAWNLNLDGDALGGEWLPEPRARFVQALLRATFDLLGESPGFHLVAEPHPKDLAARDLGLGTSSAVAVALAQAVLPVEPRDSQRILALALNAHEKVQGGRGSGADVTTAWAGHAIRYERAPGGLPRFEAISTPPGFYFSAAFSGQSQRTSAAVQAFEQLELRQPGEIERFRKGSAQVVELTLEKWNKGGAALVTQVERAGKLMTGLARLLNCAAPVPEFLLAAARASGGAIKASGGIGGDCVCLLASNREDLVRVQKMAAGAGYEPLDLQPVFGGA